MDWLITLPVLRRFQLGKCWQRWSARRAEHDETESVSPFFRQSRGGLLLADTGLGRQSPSNITEGLVARGWDVTLFATGDSLTSARLHAVVDRGYEEDVTVDPKVAEYLHISAAFERAGDFDLIHSHYDFMALTYTRLINTPVLTTIHGFSSPQIMQVYQKYRDGYFVSISNSDRASGLNYLATVYNGIDLTLYPLQAAYGDALIFLGRIHPDKGVHLAIEVARQSGWPLLIAGIIQDKRYYKEQVEPHLDDRQIRYIGPVDVPGKNALFARACTAALEHDSRAIRTCSGRGECRWRARDRDGSGILP